MSFTLDEKDSDEKMFKNTVKSVTPQRMTTVLLTAFIIFLKHVLHI